MLLFIIVLGKSAVAACCQHLVGTSDVVMLMPGFHHSVAVLPLPLCRAVVPLPFFHSVATVAVAGENGIVGNVFPYT